MYHEIVNYEQEKVTQKLLYLNFLLLASIGWILKIIGIGK